MSWQEVFSVGLGDEEMRREIGMDRLKLVAVILAGGAGTRFWPLSTEDIPKQFLKILGDKTLLRMSFERLQGIVSPEHVLVLTNKAYIGQVALELPEVPRENLIGEPMRKDTAAAVCLAALICRRLFGNPVMAVLTADHMIEPVGEFQKALLGAVQEAQKTDALFTFGIRPTYPATGYGYLELGEKLSEQGGLTLYRVSSFKEKPDLDTAMAFVSSGRFMWNSGMFVWQTEAILKQMRLHLPLHVEALTEAVVEMGTGGWEPKLEDAFGKLPRISVDYGVMEKAQRVLCAVGNFRWSDVGGWPSLGEFLPKDRWGNSVRGRVFCEEAQGNVVYCEDPSETVALVGVRGVVVVRAGTKTLIMSSNRAERLKALIQTHGSQI